MNQKKFNAKPAIIPKKRLGQNFLINTTIQEKIISSCDLKPTDVVLEIGAGKGALTEAIAKQVNHVYAIETDEGLVKYLEQNLTQKNISVIHADILHYSFKSLPNNIKVIGNLPYNIASPIIEKVLLNRKQFTSLYMTVQLEFGKRLLAKPHTKDYGSLSCFIQYYTQGKMLFKIKNSAFYPIPKVQSCFLCLKILSDPKKKLINEKYLFQIIRQAFGQRRKTIQNSLQPLCAKNDLLTILTSIQIDPRSRAENLSLEDYIRLADRLIKKNNKIARELNSSHPSP